LEEVAVNDYVTLAVLSYHRPELLKRSLQTLRVNTQNVPHELIVVDDGSRDQCWPILFQEARSGNLSTLIINAGDNMGVGEGIFRAWEMAQGRYLGKLDADLEYKPFWLSRGISVLEENPEIGMVGFFDYRHYDKNDERFNVLEQSAHKTDGGGEWWFGIVDDFVGSAFLMRRSDYLLFGPIDRGSAAFAEDVMLKRKLQEHGFKLAITIPDTIINVGFGQLSEVVKNGEVTKISQLPKILGG
jgi:GT2 family glycosyltransferase